MWPASLRQEPLDERPSWTAIFTKAYALVSDQFPELRRAYIQWPYTHLVEFPRPIATIACERHIEDENAVLFAHVKYPAESTLKETTDLLHRYSDQPVAEIPAFHRVLRIAGWPRPIRRLLWWFGLNLPRQRARYFELFPSAIIQRWAPNRFTQSLP